MRRVEAELWNTAYNTFIVKNIDITDTCTSGDAFATDSSTFERLQRVVNSCERVYHRTLKELDLARAHGLRTPQPETGPEPKPAEPTQASQPEQSKPTSTSSASFRQNPPPAPPSASPEAPASPAKPQPRRFPTPDEAMDAALEAISNESSPDL
jgi:hypothetical protein